jgi:hypothetical protein
LRVVNPYASSLTFLDDRTRTRRDHEKYLTLIDTIVLLHQYQRPAKAHQGKPYVEATLADVELANRLAAEVLGRSLDELPPQTRRLLELVEQMVNNRCVQEQIARSDYHFSRREMREFSGWTDFQVRVHLERLKEMEYVLAHRGRRGQLFEYELLYAGEGVDGDKFVMGLVEVGKLVNHSSKFEGLRKDFEGQNGKLEPSLRSQSGVMEGRSSVQFNGDESAFRADAQAIESPKAKNASPAYARY